MRDFDDYDRALFEHLHNESAAMKLITPNRDRVVYTIDKIIEALAIARRNYATYDDMDMALEEIGIGFGIWRIRNDPAYEPELP